MRKRVKNRLSESVAEIFYETRSAFPFRAVFLANHLTRVRCMTYDMFAAAGNTTYEEVVKTCNSSDGCTFFDTAERRYLIVFNDSPRRGATKPRINWTIAHEVGHILAGHFTELEALGETKLGPSNFQEMEEEADWFAANLLAPLPAIRALGATSAADVRDWFGLSQTAAEHRWHEYCRKRCPVVIERCFDGIRVCSVVKDAQMRKAFHAVQTGGALDVK